MLLSGSHHLVHCSNKPSCKHPDLAGDGHPKRRRRGSMSYNRVDDMPVFFVHQRAAPSTFVTSKSLSIGWPRALLGPLTVPRTASGDRPRMALDWGQPRFRSTASHLSCSCAQRALRLSEHLPSAVRSPLISAHLRSCTCKAASRKASGDLAQNCTTSGLRQTQAEAPCFRGSVAPSPPVFRAGGEALPHHLLLGAA